MNLLGLISNFTGSLFLAFSVIENPNEAHQLIKGKKVLLALILTQRFRIGILLLVLGFILQIASLLFQTDIRVSPFIKETIK